LTLHHRNGIVKGIGRDDGREEEYEEGNELTHDEIRRGVAIRWGGFKMCSNFANEQSKISSESSKEARVIITKKTKRG
jgi:hypothetical protein